MGGGLGSGPLTWGQTGRWQWAPGDPSSPLLHPKMDRVSVPRSQGNRSSHRAAGSCTPLSRAGKSINTSDHAGLNAECLIGLLGLLLLRPPSGKPAHSCTLPLREPEHRRLSWGSVHPTFTFHPELPCKTHLRLPIAGPARGSPEPTPESQTRTSPGRDHPARETGRALGGRLCRDRS